MDGNHARVALPRPPEIDWPALEKRFPGKPAFIRRLVQAALDAHADDVELLSRLAAARDFAGLAHLTHSLKGICGNLAAPAAHALAAATEAAARAREPAAFERIPALAERVETFLGELRAFLARPPLESEKAT